MTKYQFVRCLIGPERKRGKWHMGRPTGVGNGWWHTSCGTWFGAQRAQIANKVPSVEVMCKKCTKHNASQYAEMAANHPQNDHQD